MAAERANDIALNEPNRQRALDAMIEYLRILEGIRVGYDYGGSQAAQSVRTKFVEQLRLNRAIVVTEVARFDADASRRLEQTSTELIKVMRAYERNAQAALDLRGTPAQDEIQHRVLLLTEQCVDWLRDAAR